MINNFTKLFLVTLGLGLGYAAQAATEPTVQPLVGYNPVSGTTATVPSAALKLTAGNGTRYLVVVRLSSAARVAPTDGVTYTANLAYGATGTNRTTGTGNFVVYADVPPAAVDFNKITVTGLAANSSYVVDVYAYNQDGTGIDYLQSNPSTLSFTALPTYTWNAATNLTDQDFNSSNLWTPSRSSRTANDVLVFDGAFRATSSVKIARGDGTNAGQTFGQLFVVNNANVNITAPSTANEAGVLTIGNANTPGDDFVTEAGTTISVGATSNTDNRYVYFRMPTGTTASIGGNYSILTGSTIVPHRLSAADAGAIRFRNGSVYSGQTVIGYPFGTTGTIPNGNANTNGDIAAGAGSVIFEAGSTFEHRGGLDPFGNGATAVTTFQSGSTYRYFGGTISAAARTYPNWDFQATYSTTGAFATTVLNNLTVNFLPSAPSNVVTVSLNNTGGVSVGGNIEVNGASQYGAGLYFEPTSAANLTLNGTGGKQTISGISTLSIGANTTLVLNNPQGVELLRVVDVPKALTFGAQSGNLITSGTNYLSMPTSATVTGADADSYVEGAMMRVTPAAGTYAITTPGSTGLFFPVGIPAGYGPISIGLTQTGTGAGVYFVTPIVGRAPSYTLAPNDLKRVSGVRYYNLYSSVPFNNGQVAMGFVAIDQVDAPSTLRVAQGVNGGWLNLGGTVTPAMADGTTFLTGTVTSNAGLTSLGDFSLATTNLSNAPGNNPLPVELTSFTAERRGSDALLRWTTALEKNSAYFEVQRSRDGREFQSIGRVQAQGNSTRAISYSFLDKGAAGTVYYRLRQVDLDGTATDSRIVVLGGSEQLLVSAYPNPVQNELHLLLGENPVQWRVLNLVGQPLRQGKALGEATVDLSTLPAGSYQLEVRNGTQRVIRPLIKTN